MDSLLQPIARLNTELKWFVTATEHTALHVLVGDGLRGPVLKQIAEAEQHPRNRSVFVFTEAAEDAENGWAARLTEFQADMDELAAQLQQHAPPMELPPRPVVGASGTPLTRFALQLRDVAATTPAPIEGLTLVLAPSGVADPSAWSRDLQALLSQPLPRVRYVVVEPVHCSSRVALSSALGKRLLSVDVVVDPAVAKRDLNAMQAAIAAAPAGSVGMALAGAAGPRVLPPRRKGAVEPKPPAALAALFRDAGVPEAYADPEGMKRLRALILDAAGAASDGDFLRAIRVQSDARDHADALALPLEAMVLEHMLGAYVMQAGHPARAVSIFESAFQRAAALQAGAHMVQCKLSVATAQLTQRQVDAAVLTYAEAGALGAQHQVPAFAIEAYRMGGQLLAGQRRGQDAAAMWQRALQVAEAGDKLEVSMSSAADVARALAKLCRERGLVAQAQSLEEQAVVLETPPPLPEEEALAQLGVTPAGQAEEGA